VGKKIIVADDSVTVQKVMKLILAPQGYDVECYGNGKEALEAIRKNVPAVVFADAMMPEMSGVDIGAELKKGSKDLKNIPVVLLYSTFDDVTTVDFSRSGAAAKIAKPFDDQQILELVDKLSSREMDNIEEGVWNMNHFVEPEVPDAKTTGNPVKNEVPVFDEEGFFNMDSSEQIPELGIPEPEEMKTFKEQRDPYSGSPPPPFNIPVSDATAPISEENLSEEDAKKLLNDFNLKENPDGTINFDDIKPEKDLGLWSKKYYAQEEEEQEQQQQQQQSLEVASGDVEAITRDVVEKMVKKMLPDIAERIIREEIAKIVDRK